MGSDRLPAASRYLGIELDAGLVEKSRDNARRAGVAERVSFVQGDVLVTPFVLLALAVDSTSRLTRPLLRHGRVIELVGGGLVVLIGLAIMGLSIHDPDPTAISFPSRYT